jgi:thiol-disulfide isomerase/thioredoxin
MLRRPAFVLVAVLTLAACGTSTSTSQTAAGEGPAGTGTVADLDFTATTLDGDTFEGRELAGEPAVLWWWAPWCPTCRAQIPNLSRLAEDYQGQVSVVGVGGLDSDAAIRHVAGQIPFVTHLVDPDGAVWRHFGVTAQSSYTVIAADGEILSEGYLDDAELNGLIAGLAD